MITSLFGNQTDKDVSRVLKIAEALAIYHTKPSNNLADLNALKTLTELHPELLNTVPLDKWGSPFEYRYLTHSPLTFMIYSSGSIRQNNTFTFYLFREENNRFIMAKVES
ncbi:hypothetical protein N473_04190 [Pseudoalteromonas luteoviolacea CPMOR-1]|uniref:Type II secretion system protein GspG C-terminal domain-containing protein n=1 Tax=Pseudoalteromonas luteoviolacea CPMOR-1 TaxID=1365248 RepID=A0A161YEN5_9GAMM|nr:hypothetical protein [Pseudoalteromonas luteoviolacea]KZN58637.1 hypothetical protein N473_04190 [Pseudoalteromonas luteoviolacea CPMOR-1]